jgi:hypothetical protein
MAAHLRAVSNSGGSPRGPQRACSFTSAPCSIVELLQLGGIGDLVVGGIKGGSRSGNNDSHPGISLLSKGINGKRLLTDLINFFQSARLLVAGRLQQLDRSSPAGAKIEEAGPVTDKSPTAALQNRVMDEGRLEKSNQGVWT